VKYYVVTAPEPIRGIFTSWAECKSKVDGVRGARFQSVDSLEKAEAMLGDGVVLLPGLYAFTDGNAAGGVGVVVLEQGMGDAGVIHEVSTTVAEVLAHAGIPGLESGEAVAEALGRLHNILAEMTGLYHALSIVPLGSTFTVLHDYEGVGAWMQRRWQVRDPIVAGVVEACRGVVQSRKLKVTYRHQRGHQSTWAGRDDYARWNGRADELATQAAQR
jgi:Caulimovirus viroplasmin